MSCFIFAVILTSIFAGMLLRKILPKHHLSDESKDVVRLGAGLVATLGALVLGLLIASAKSSYDTQSGHIKQITANVILLDRLLAKYGPEARRIREDLRQSLNPLVARINRARKARLRSDDQPPFAEHAYKSGRPVERLKQELSRMVLGSEW